MKRTQEEGEAGRLWHAEVWRAADKEARSSWRTQGNVAAKQAAEAPARPDCVLLLPRWSVTLGSSKATCRSGVS